MVGIILFSWSNTSGTQWDHPSKDPLTVARMFRELFWPTKRLDLQSNVTSTKIHPYNDLKAHPSRKLSLKQTKKKGIFTIFGTEAFPTLSG